jgi:PAS domain S-box-containing protein
VSVIGGELGLYLERKRFEEMGSQSEVRQAAIVDAALDSIISMDHRGFITHFNHAAERTFGYKSEDVIGKELAELIIPPDFARRTGRVLRDSRCPGNRECSTIRVETWAQKADGTKFPVELAITRIPLDGAPAFTGFVRDITARKKAEQATRDSEERYRALLPHQWRDHHPRQGNSHRRKSCSRENVWITTCRSFSDATRWIFSLRRSRVTCCWSRCRRKAADLMR